MLYAAGPGVVYLQLLKRHRVSLQGSLVVPVCRLLFTGRHSPTMFIHYSQVVLGLTVFLTGRLLQPVKGCFVILGDTCPGTVQGSKLILGPRVTLACQRLKQLNGRTIITQPDGRTYLIKFSSIDSRAGDDAGCQQRRLASLYK